MVTNGVARGHLRLLALSWLLGHLGLAPFGLLDFIGLIYTVQGSIKSIEVAPLVTAVSPRWLDFHLTYLFLDNLIGVSAH